MKKSYLTYIASLLLFGSNGVVASSVDLSSYEIVFWRTLIGGSLLLLLFLLSKQPFNGFRHKKDFLFVFLSGIAMAANWLFLFEAYAQIGVSLGMLINYCGPAIVIALSPLILRERITRPMVLSLLCALTGVFLISGQAAVSGLRTTGLFCAVLSALAFAAMILLNKKSVHITGMENSTLQLLSCLLVIFIYTGLKQGFPLPLGNSNLLPILWIGLVNTGMGCYLYFSSIGKLPVRSVSVLGYLEPLSAVLFSQIFLHETMGFLQYIGAVLIIGGAVFGEWKRA